MAVAKAAGATTSTGNGQGQGGQGQGQATGGVWKLVSITATPATPAKEWNYSTQTTVARYTLYNGDVNDYAWSTVPSQIDSRGFR